MVKIRLARTGKTNQPSYRIVVADKRAPRDGRHIEVLGHYSPLGDKEVEINQEKYEEWIKKGAQPSKTVKRLVNSN